MRWSGSGYWLLINVIIIDATDILSRRVQLRRDVTPPYDVDNDVQFDGRQKGDLYVSPLTRFSDIYCQYSNVLNRNCTCCYDHVYSE